MFRWSFWCTVDAFPEILLPVAAKLFAFCCKTACQLLQNCLQFAAKLLASSTFHYFTPLWIVLLHPVPPFCPLVNNFSFGYQGESDDDAGEEGGGEADWHIHRSLPLSLSPAGSLIGFAATRYRGQPPGLHLFLILTNLIVNLSDTCTGLSCLSLFQVWAGGGQMVAVWSKWAPLQNFKLPVTYSSTFTSSSSVMSHSLAANAHYSLFGKH